MSAVDSLFQLIVSGLRDAGDEIVRRRIVEVDPLGRGGGLKFVVDEVLRIEWFADLIVSGRV